MKKNALLAVSLVSVSLFIGGCPGMGGEPSVLEGDWQTTLEGDIDVTFTFNSDGEVTRIVGERGDGATASFTVSGSTSEVNENDVTVTVPVGDSTAMFEGTLSEDQNTMEGMLTAEIEFGDALVVTLPAGDLTLERVADGG